MDLKSIMGYRKDSPYKNDPYIDIFSPEGLIDMSMTDKDLIGIDNRGNKKVMKAGRKTPYRFEGDTIREIPMQKGGYQMQQMYNEIFGDDDDEMQQPSAPTAPSVEEIDYSEQEEEIRRQQRKSEDDQFNMISMGIVEGSFYNDRKITGNPYKGAGEYGEKIIGELSNDLGYTPEFNSVWRSPEKQQQLIKQGVGVKNSWHLTGDAVDMKPADWKRLPQEKQAYYRQNYDVVYHNNHYHIEPKGQRK